MTWLQYHSIDIAKKKCLNFPFVAFEDPIKCQC